MTDYGKSVFLFRRDLRISDNTGLIEASQASKTVLPLFIFGSETRSAKSVLQSECVPVHDRSTRGPRPDWMKGYS